MHAMKSEILPILAQLPATLDALDAMKRAAIALDAACRACDGSTASWDIVLDVADMLQAASATCASVTEDVNKCAYQVFNRKPYYTS